SGARRRWFNKSVRVRIAAAGSGGVGAVVGSGGFRIVVGAVVRRGGCRRWRGGRPAGVGAVIRRRIGGRVGELQRPVGLVLGIDFKEARALIAARQAILYPENCEAVVTGAQIDASRPS